MSITDTNSNTSIVDLGAVGANTLEAIVRRWRFASWGISKAVAGIRDPRLRGDIQRLIEGLLTGQAPEPASLPEERSAALATMCETLLRQFDDEHAGAAEIRLVVHKRDDLSPEPARGSQPDSGPAGGAEDEELVWELRRLLAASGGMISDVAHALERRADNVDRNGRELLQDEVSAVEVDIAILKTLLSDPVDWDKECKRLLAGEVPPFEDRAVEDNEQDDDG
jgi:hypothetical protein